VCTLALLFGASIALDPEQKCVKKSKIPIPHVVRESLTPVEVPDQHLWNNVNSTSFVTNIRNQHLP
jgi:hypothetical protein